MHSHGILYDHGHINHVFGNMLIVTCSWPRYMLITLHLVSPCAPKSATQETHNLPLSLPLGPVTLFVFLAMNRSISYKS